MVSIATPRARTPLMPLKTGGTARKRDSSVLESTQASQSKRLKVTFDPNVEVQLVDDWNEKGFDLIREEVRQALLRHTGGTAVGLDEETSRGYEEIRQLFSKPADDDDPPSVSLLRKYLLALTGNVSLLNKPCSGLVHAVLNCQWLGRDEKFVTVYLRFLGSLVSAQGGYISVVLEMLVDKFTGISSLIGRLPNNAEVPRSQLYARVHTALKYILQLIPSASGTLASILSSMFPYASDSTRVHVAYVRNLLRTIDYAHELQSAILDLITERVAKIDVQIQMDIEDLEDDIEESLITGGPTRTSLRYDNENSHDSDDESSMSDMTGDDEERRFKDLKASVTKLDTLLDLLFEYYAPYFAGEGVAGQLDLHLEQLLSQFVNIILPTYRSRYTQFLLFHFSQVSPDLAEKFTTFCAHIAFDKRRSTITRLSAAAYLSSYVARGAHVSGHVVKEVFDRVGSQLEHIRIAHEATCRGPDLRRYPVYYATAQALLYIFCFRWRDLVVDSDEYDGYDFTSPDDRRDISFLPWIGEVLRKNIYSRFNPLKVCAPAIVTQFARIAHHLQFLYVFPLLETNKRLHLTRSTGTGYNSINVAPVIHLPSRETALSSKLGEQFHQLDTYFPFDPYHLPLSKRWLEGDYNEWRSIPGLDDDDDVGEEEVSVGGEEEEAGDDELEVGTGTDEE